MKIKPNNRLGHRGSLRGFTLVELMLATVVVTIVALGASAFIVRSYKILNRAKKMTVATSLANGTMEYLANTRRDDLPRIGTDLLAGTSNKVWIVMSTNYTWSVGADRTDYDGVFSMLAEANGSVQNDSPVRPSMNRRPAEVVTLEGTDYFIITRITLMEEKRLGVGNYYYYLRPLISVVWDEGSFEMSSRCAL
jgi:prepilin-type N-terminal cleavage/methylation domain-containing protein